MARNTRTTHTGKPSMLDRLRNRKATSTTTTKRSKNPITGSTTTTQTTTTNGHGHGHGHTHAGTAAQQPVHHHKRKPSMGDKISGAMMKLEGSLTRKPGKKAAGTRRMHGTDGRGSHAAATRV